jgi:hypothetical protein
MSALHNLAAAATSSSHCDGTALVGGPETPTDCRITPTSASKR